jgi:2-iminobutanoate/2-iminopropanoate deaminase
MKGLRRIPTQWSYSLAVEAGDTVYLGLHRGRGEDFTTQLDNTFRFIDETLAAVGLTRADLVKVNVWLKDIKDLPVMEKRFFAYFEDGQFPARMTSTTEFIDDDCLVMVDGIAYRSEG